MTEPDFEQIASDLHFQAHERNEAIVPHIIAALRQVWNARGAADLEVMEAAHTNYDWSELEDGIKALDR
jgi:hypothetical protein